MNSSKNKKRIRETQLISNYSSLSKRHNLILHNGTLHQILYFIQRNGNLYQRLPEWLKEDMRIQLAAVKSNVNVF